MPTFTPEQLHHTGVALFRAAGASAEEAQVVWSTWWERTWPGMTPTA